MQISPAPVLFVVNGGLLRKLAVLCVVNGGLFCVAGDVLSGGQKFISKQQRTQEKTTQLQAERNTPKDIEKEEHKNTEQKETSKNAEKKEAPKDGEKEEHKNATPVLFKLSGAGVSGMKRRRKRYHTSIVVQY